jgi:hypothetical protein
MPAAGRASLAYLYVAIDNYQEVRVFMKNGVPAGQRQDVITGTAVGESDE